MVNEIYMDGGRKKARPITNRADYIAQRNHPDNAKNFYDARGGDQKAKARQRQYNYSDLLPDGVLKGCCHPSSTFPHDIDCNSAEEQERIKRILLEKKDETGLLELSGSANYGLHGIFRREPGKTILECQVKVALLTHTEMDTSAHDLQRVLYTGPATADNLFFLDDALFTESLTIEESAAEYERLKERVAQGLEEVPPGAKKANKHYRPWEEEMDDGRGNPSPDLPRGGGEGGAQKVSPRGDLEGVGYKGIPYADIINEYWQRTGGVPVDGERNVRLHKLAVNLRAICDNKREVLLAVMPRLGLSEQEMASIVDSACKETPKGISKIVKQIINDLQESSLPLKGAEGEAPPPMPHRLPRLIQLLTSKTPDVYKAAVAHAVFPPLATHLCDVRFTYTDNMEHEATLMNCLMAGTGAGKGCIDKPIEHIMADIERRDKENERREAEWKKDCQKKGANKDKLLRPEGLVIQIIDPDMTKPALVTRMDEAEGHFVYVKLNELDLFEQLKGATGKQHFQLMCLAFDCDATYGQTRIGTQSVTARPMCRFNWNACTTILKGRRFFRNVLTDGPISRINFCTIPEQEIGAKQPVFGQYDLAFDEALKPYIDNLVAARGLIASPQAYKLAIKLQDECAEFAQLSQNDTYWNLSHRACVIAWLKACVLYVANGQKWEKSIEDFIRWSLNYDLWCKMQFFGNKIEEANKTEESRIGTRGPKSLLLYLPDEFTTEDAVRVRQKEGLSADNTKKMISQWKTRGYILQLTVDSFKKVKNKNQ